MKKLIILLVAIIAVFFYSPVKSQNIVPQASFGNGECLTGIGIVGAVNSCTNNYDITVNWVNPDSHNKTLVVEVRTFLGSLVYYCPKKIKDSGYDSYSFSFSLSGGGPWHISATPYIGNQNGNPCGPSVAGDYYVYTVN
jgi:hypothetical protein